jgi:fatty acid desaturase
MEIQVPARMEGELVDIRTSASVLPPGTGENADRPADMPIPNRLNCALVLADVSLAVALLWLASWLTAWYAVLPVGIIFSYLMLTNYALLHEATHDNLHSNPRWNYALGVVSGILFLAPFSMIRVTHQGHHQRNRTDAEMFDLYYAGDSFFLKCCQWYGTLSGLFWPCIPVCAVLFALSPRTIGLQLFSGPPFGNANVKDITSRDLRRIRFELVLTFAVFALLYWLLDWPWRNVAILYFCFSLNWSTRQYVGHAFTRRDIVEGALNLRHNRLMSSVLLHGEWDLNHHRHPEVSWYYLPTIETPPAPRDSYSKQYWRQWLGPRLATEPSPEVTVPPSPLGGEGPGMRG